MRNDYDVIAEQHRFIWDQRYSSQSSPYTCASARLCVSVCVCVCLCVSVGCVLHFALEQCKKADVTAYRSCPRLFLASFLLSFPALSISWLHGCPSRDEQDMTWEKELAKKYHDKLFKVVLKAVTFPTKTRASSDGCFCSYVCAKTSSNRVPSFVLVPLL